MSPMVRFKFKFGLIYTGSDDGKLFRTKDGGNTWTDIGSNLPKDKWVSRIQASSHQESRVYASLNGYRDDDFTAYVYVSDDYGDTWKNIAGTLPSEPINVIKEDPANEKLLFVGTDHGVYASTDGGDNFMLVDVNMPRVPVHDLVIQERENHLLVGTHGRSIYRLDIAPLQNLDEVRSSELHLFAIKSMRHRDNWGNKRRPYSEPNTPELNLTVYSAREGAGILSISLDGTEVQKTNVDLKKGVSEVVYNLTIDASKKKKYEKKLAKMSEKKTKVELKEADDGNFYLRPGTYDIKISCNGKTSTSTFELK